MTFEALLLKKPGEQIQKSEKLWERLSERVMELIQKHPDDFKKFAEEKMTDNAFEEARRKMWDIIPVGDNVDPEKHEENLVKGLINTLKQEYEAEKRKN